jgi:hypothetical protein
VEAKKTSYSQVVARKPLLVDSQTQTSEDDQAQASALWNTSPVTTPSVSQNVKGKPTPSKSIDQKTSGSSGPKKDSANAVKLSVDNSKKNNYDW